MEVKRWPIKAGVPLTVRRGTSRRYRLRMIHKWTATRGKMRNLLDPVEVR